MVVGRRIDPVGGAPMAICSGAITRNRDVNNAIHFSRMEHDYLTSKFAGSSRAHEGIRTLDLLHGKDAGQDDRKRNEPPNRTVTPFPECAE